MLLHIANLLRNIGFEILLSYVAFLVHDVIRSLGLCPSDEGLVCDAAFGVSRHLILSA